MLKHLNLNGFSKKKKTQIDKFDNFFFFKGIGEKKNKNTWNCSFMRRHTDRMQLCFQLSVYQLLLGFRTYKRSGRSREKQINRKKKKNTYLTANVERFRCVLHCVLNQWQRYLPAYAFIQSTGIGKSEKQRIFFPLLWMDKDFWCKK